MKPSILLLSVLFTVLLNLPAEETSTGELEKLLREALFEEEAAQDLAQAAKGYERLLDTYRSQRQFAATALFRLAEVRRKQERPKDAAKLYQQLLAEFPMHDPLARVSRENLVALGAQVPSAETALGLLDEEAKEIERLRKIVSESPDLISAMDKEGYAPVHRAAKNGHIRVLEFLLENGVDVNHEIYKGTALSIAAQYGHLKTCEYLIKCEADLELSSPLGEAIVSGFQTVGKLLLDKGADPNGSHLMKRHWDIQKPVRKEVMTMLGLSVFRGGHPFVKLLLERGADVDLVADGGTSTPLIWSMARQEEEIFALLLAQGADVNMGDDQFPTALHYAIGEPQGPERKRLMVRLGVVGKDLLGFARQLVSRTDLSAKDELGSTVLIAAVRAELYDLVPVLIEAEAEVDARDNKERTALLYTLDNGNWDEARKLIDRGADPDIEVQGKPLLELVPSNMRVHLMRLRYPDLNKQQAITLSLPQVPYHTSLATGAGDPPNLASVLLDWETPPSAPQANNQGVDWTQARIFRQVPKEIIDVTLSRSLPLPRLEWGDVIEFTTPNWESINRHARNPLSHSTRSWYYDEDFKALLRAKRTLNVNVMVDGKTYELALRGDRTVYDPRFREAPLVPLDRLAGLLGIHKRAAVRVERRDQGGFFQVVLGESGDKIELEDGDTLTVTRDEGRFAERITFASPDLLFGSSLSKEGPPPTLLQFLAMQYQPVSPKYLAFYAGQLGSDTPWLWDAQALAEIAARGPNSAQLMALLPFPDWSTLRIRRGDTLIDVNLQEAIDACDDSTTPEQARDWDQPLQWGDVVEVHAKSADDPWTGFTAETRRLFQKALRRQVVFQDPSGLVRSVMLSYVPALYLNGSSGPIPVPSGKMGSGRVPIPRADALVKSFSTGSERVAYVYRSDELLTEYPAKTWLQDGDRVIAKNHARTPSSPVRNAVQKNNSGTVSPSATGKRRVIVPPGG